MQAALIREATLLRRFQHQHVLLLYTSFVVGRELWMVMPYMDLGSVRSIMRKTSPQVCIEESTFGGGGICRGRCSVDGDMPYMDLGLLPS